MLREASDARGWLAFRLLPALKKPPVDPALSRSWERNLVAHQQLSAAHGGALEPISQKERYPNITNASICGALSGSNRFPSSTEDSASRQVRIT